MNRENTKIDAVPLSVSPPSVKQIEQIRFRGEQNAAAAVREDVWLKDMVNAAEARQNPDAGRVRRALLANSVLLTEGMAPDTWDAAQQAAAALGVERPLEIYQAAGQENAGIHLVEEPVLLEIRGRLLSLLDHEATVAVFGHELGHFLVHGPTSPDSSLGLVINTALEFKGVPEASFHHVSVLSMAREITADRFGLLAVGSLDAALRLEMVATTGLASGELNWNTKAYLAQCRALVEEMQNTGTQVEGVSHPEHGLRSWALWLFSESDLYKEITGRGEGTRPINEVDAEIAAVLGGTPASGIADVAIAFEPIPEVHECALACAALVALADDELAEEESLAIEGVFGHLIEDWQRYLVWDNALEAFSDTGAVIAAEGAGQQRALFQVLVHVLTADGKIEQREIEIICALGDALGCGTLFRAMLTPVLQVLGYEQTPNLDQIDKPIPLPTRSDEAEAALDTFFRGMLRRGGGHTSLRRLYLLLGDKEGTDKSRATISRLMARVGLAVDCDIADVSWNRQILFQPTTEAQTGFETKPSPAEPQPDAPARARLARALLRLRDQLVNGDGRSPSIRLRRCRIGRSFDLHELEGMSVGHGVRVLTLTEEGADARVVDGKEVGIHESASRISRELVALEREALAQAEQTGAQDLSIGAPFLTGVFQGYLVRGPLILHPVVLERTKGRGFKIVSRDGEGPTANQALIRLLFNKNRLDFPDTLGEQLNAAAGEGLDALKSTLAEYGITPRLGSESLSPFTPRDDAFATWPDGRLVIERCAVLGFFPQSSSDMIQDFDQLISAVNDPRVQLAERLGAAGALLPADLREALRVDKTEEETIRAETPHSPDPVPTSGDGEKATENEPAVPVVPADPSQLAVLDKARRSRALVVDGPPGTGKSQVIVNLVADALFRGESVAVVCEKRAALDVVAQRLEQAGLRHLLAVVHDVHNDRRPLYNQVLRRLDEGALREYDTVRGNSTITDLTAVRDSLEERRRALAMRLNETTPTLGELHLLASSFVSPALEGLDPSLVHLSLEKLQRLSERLGQESRNIDLYREGSVWRPPKGGSRPSLGDATPDDLSRVEDALRSAVKTARVLDDLRAAQNIARDVRTAASTLCLAVASRPVRQTPAGRAAFAAFLHRSHEPALSSMIAPLKTAWQEFKTWAPIVPERAAFEGSSELTSALDIAASWGTRFFRFFSIAWWRARGFIKRTLAVQWPAAVARSFTPKLIQDIRLRQSGAAGWKRLDKLLGALNLSPLLPDSEAAKAEVDILLNTWDAANPLIESRQLLEVSSAWPGSGDTDLSDWEEKLDNRCKLAEAERAHAEALSPVIDRFPWISETADSKIVDALHDAWTMEAARVVAADRNLDAAESLAQSARRMVYQLADLLPEGNEITWTEAVQHGYARLMLDAVERGFPSVRVLDRATIAGEIPEAEARLAELVDARSRVHIEALLAEQDNASLLAEARPDKGQRRTPIQKTREQMLREASKKRYILSLRGFVRQFADQGLMEALPVWLLSPETMAVLFPGKPVFDLVVMDEASQATVEKGLPALIRGHRAVIAGDEHQMPPSSFFELKSQENDDTPGTAETVETDELTAESLLVLARERCPHVGLIWHYRCLHEELITFSNHAMYGGDLYTIPSTSTPFAPPALRWVEVENGAYDSGANPVEAKQVVDVVAELLDTENPPSIGVVTFNIQQRKAILDRLDHRAEADERFSERYASACAHEDVSKRPFVKNLERVQGDERDVIIFSLGHAPVLRKSGPLKGQPYVPARFGPLGQLGGERRLNVAVSRAKQSCIVVSSFTPNMLSVADTRNEGPKLFKAFLEFVWDLTHGRRRQADRALERIRSGGLGVGRGRDRSYRLGVPSLAAQIGLELEGHGVGFDLDVGTSGFKVPLALRDPGNPDAWKVAVLTDEGHEQGDVDEVHRHAPLVLRARGWRVERVNSRSWHLDPEAVLKRLLASLEQ